MMPIAPRFSASRTVKIACIWLIPDVRRLFRLTDVCARVAMTSWPASDAALDVAVGMGSLNSDPKPLPCVSLYHLAKLAMPQQRPPGV